MCIARGDIKILSAFITTVSISLAFHTSNSVERRVFPRGSTRRVRARARARARPPPPPVLVPRHWTYFAIAIAEKKKKKKRKRRENIQAAGDNL